MITIIHVPFGVMNFTNLCIVDVIAENRHMALLLNMMLYGCGALTTTSVCVTKERLLILATLSG